MQLSNIIGLPVFSIYDCQNVGYVLDVVYTRNLNKIAYFVVSDDDNEVIYTINIRSIYKISNECVLIKNNTKLNVSTLEPNNIVGHTILSLDGQKDSVKDVCLDENYCVQSIQGQKITFGCQDILYRQNKIVILKDSAGLLKRKNFAPRIRNVPSAPQNATQSVSILNSISQPIQVRVNSTNSVIGKHLTQNLYSRQNEVLATKDSTITQSTVNIARQFGVLNQLIALAK